MWYDDPMIFIVVLGLAFAAIVIIKIGYDWGKNL
jgi:hypothetical protein